ncbi:MAG: hypothetical protein U5R06_11570 [candidate division KSB1 bacterium]|nr:hypothetical protein [candidate division KSB1 bacterium]
MKRTCFCIILLLICNSLFAVELEPVRISDYRSKTIKRSLYSIRLNTPALDTALFVRKVRGLDIKALKPVSDHELLIIFRIDSGFTDFDAHQIALIDSSGQEQSIATLNVFYDRPPVIDSLQVRSSGPTAGDTLTLSGGRTTLAVMHLYGTGLFKHTQIAFDDPAVRVKQDAGWRRVQAPDLMQIGLEIDNQDVQIGKKRFRVKNEYAMEGFGSLFIKAARRPHIISKIEGFTADGTVRNITLHGTRFRPGIQARLLPRQGMVQVETSTPQSVNLSLHLPVMEQSKSFQLVLINPDGQADTTSYFTVRTPPLSHARISPLNVETIFPGKRIHVLVHVDTRAGRTLNPGTAYDINIEGDRFPVLRVVNDSTCEAVIQISSDQTALLWDQHVFTVQPADAAPQWRGTIKSQATPKITYTSPNRTLHPNDTLTMVIKGKHLSDAIVLIEEPDIVFDITENRGDLVRLQVRAGEHVEPGAYPLELRKNGVSFRFPDYHLTVKPWQPFEQYIKLHVNSTGIHSLEPKITINSSDVPRLIINTGDIRKNLGVQKLLIHGVLLDSLHTIRAKSVTNGNMTLKPASGTQQWRWRSNKRLRPGDRIEITISNPGGRNKRIITCVIQAKWYENVHGSTSFVLAKLPFGGKHKTQLLNSIALGVSYQPFASKEFIEFDGSFIIGNRQTNDKNAVHVGFGLSSIFWQHVQLGMGTNLTGHSFSTLYMFVGTRFKVALPF